jgi:hypothetical protein
LNFSHNFLDAKALEQFFRFLATQSPLLCDPALHSNRLLHLNLSQCFQDDAPVIERICKFFEARELWGLEICGVLPSPLLNTISGLHSLNIGDNDFDVEAVEILIDLLRDSPTISEIGINNVGFSILSSVLAFYLKILSIPRILGIERPTELFKQLGNYAEVTQITEGLSRKRNYSTTADRLQLFLALSGDFGTKAGRLPALLDDDGELEPLFETGFSNPIPSLLTIATLTGVDVKVDPIASMVAEYVATSGKYGIVSPTAPPPQPPQGKMKLPVIFATAQTPEEANGQIPELAFDPYDEVMQQFSIDLAKNLAQSQGSVDLLAAPEPWHLTPPTLAFEPVNLV